MDNLNPFPIAVFAKWLIDVMKITLKMIWLMARQFVLYVRMLSAWIDRWFAEHR